MSLYEECSWVKAWEAGAGSMHTSVNLLLLPLVSRAEPGGACRCFVGRGVSGFAVSLGAKVPGLAR
jgi:hypothetical protein